MSNSQKKQNVFDYPLHALKISGRFFKVKMITQGRKFHLLLSNFQETIEYQNKSVSDVRFKLRGIIYMRRYFI